MKIVINRSYGGFGLSQLAYKWLIEQGVPVYTRVDPFSNTPRIAVFQNEYYETYFAMHKNRTNPLLIDCIQTLGELASDKFATLGIIEIPDIAYGIGEDRGKEWVYESHRYWD